MNKSRISHLVCGSLIMLALCCCAFDRAFAYTPESPEVKQMVAKAAKYLEKSSNESELGGDCLIALALLKADYDPSHKRIAFAVTRCQNAIKNNSYRGDAIYNHALAIIFLCELDGQRYKKEIQVLFQSLLKIQKGHGAWSYETTQAGDTSQTQYGVLALWAVKHANITVPRQATEKALSWLMRTQDARGGWTYHAQDPRSYNRIQQGIVTLSLSAAGLGSVYVCADVLGVQLKANKRREDGLPGALEPVEEKKKVKAGPANVDRNILQRTLNDGNRWFQNNYRITQEEWEHYYRYALERYMSFRELAEGIEDKEPGWYNDGVEYLARRQQSDGSWASMSAESMPDINTAFAVLFLTRSTKKSIAKNVLGEGTLRGGRGLPKDPSNVRMINGKVVGPSLSRSVEDILAILEDGENDELDGLLDFPEELKFDAPLNPRDEKVQRIRDMVAKGNYKARLVAVRALVKTRSMENVPILIFALSDPDLRVMREARDGLRFLSRKFDGFGLPDSPTKLQRQDAEKAWRQWYLSVRPDAQFLDLGE